MQEALLGTTVMNSIVIWYVFPPGFLVGDTRLHLECHRVVGVRDETLNVTVLLWVRGQMPCSVFTRTSYSFRHHEKGWSAQIVLKINETSFLSKKKKCRTVSASGSWPSGFYQTASPASNNYKLWTKYKEQPSEGTGK